MSVCRIVCLFFVFFFFFKQKTAYEMRISDWSSDVCSSDLPHLESPSSSLPASAEAVAIQAMDCISCTRSGSYQLVGIATFRDQAIGRFPRRSVRSLPASLATTLDRSEEHTSELQSLMRISYAVFCLKKKIKINSNHQYPLYTPKST